MVFVSPGVYFRELDFSLYLTNLSSTIFGVVGTATKGPINEPVYISNVAAFTAKFGNPDPNHLATYAALQYLRYGRQLYFVRVNPADAAVASTVAIPGTVAAATILGTELGPYTFQSTYGGGFLGTNTSATVTITATNKFLRLAVNGGAPFTVSLTEGVGVAKSAIITELDTLLAPYGASAIAGNTWRSGTGSANAVAIQSDANGPTSRLDILTVADHAYTILGFTAGTNYGSTGNRGINVDLREVATGDITSSTFDFAWGSVTVDAAVTALNSAFDTDGLDIVATNQDNKLKLTSEVLGEGWEFRLTNPDTDPNELGAATELGISPDTWFRGRGHSPAQETFRVKANAPGDWANLLSVAFTAGSVSGSFRMNVYLSGARVETFDNIVPSTDLENEATGLKYMNDAVNGISNYVEIADEPLDMGFPTFGVTFNLSGGNDGLDSLSTDDYIEGLQEFSNSEKIDVNILAVPGIALAPVISEMILICETRADCMCIVDPPLGKTVQQVVDWHNGAAPYDDHGALNSSYAALYWPWGKIFDAFNNKYIWTPPSGHAAAVYAYTDQNSELWYAPAGFNRGKIISIQQLEHSPDLGERDLLYGDQNAVNPIVAFNKDGITIWGQRTLQRKPTALDRVNVRRLILYIRKVLATSVKYFVFEPNEPTTWRTFVGMTTPFLQTLKDKRALYDFQVRCDETTNTPDLIDRGIMNAKIFLKPVKAAEFIQVDLVLTRTGASFEEVIF